MQSSDFVNNQCIHKTIQLSKTLLVMVHSDLTITLQHIYVLNGQRLLTECTSASHLTLNVQSGVSMS